VKSLPVMMLRRRASVLWSIVRALGNGIRRRTVLPWDIDPKGGMELAFGRRLFDRLACQTTAGMLALLEDAARFMQERQARDHPAIQLIKL